MTLNKNGRIQKINIKRKKEKMPNIKINLNNKTIKKINLNNKNSRAYLKYPI